MRHPAAIALPSLLLAWVASAAADLPEPAVNTGATLVEVIGTHVTAEVRAAAFGHRVDAIVVVRLVARAGEAPVVTTYERWSLDGHKESDRGDARLGQDWEKAIRGALDALDQAMTPQERARLAPAPKDLLDRLALRQGDFGSTVAGDEVVSWALGASRAEGGGKVHEARTAVIAFTPRPPSPTEPPRTGDGTAPGGPATPGGGGGAGRAPAPSQRPPEATASPITSRSDGSSSSETGARHHARAEMDLLPPPPPPATTTRPDRPPGETSPGAK